MAPALFAKSNITNALHIWQMAMDPSNYLLNGDLNNQPMKIYVDTYLFQNVQPSERGGVTQPYFSWVFTKDLKEASADLLLNSFGFLCFLDIRP